MLAADMRIFQCNADHIVQQTALMCSEVRVVAHLPDLVSAAMRVVVKAIDRMLVCNLQQLCVFSSTSMLSDSTVHLHSCRQPKPSPAQSPCCEVGCNQESSATDAHFADATGKVEYFTDARRL